MLWVSYKMKTQKVLGLLNDSSNKESKFATKKWYVIDCQTAKDKYNQNNSLKFETENIKSSFWDYSDAFILVTGDITVNTEIWIEVINVALKNCAPFSACKTEIDDVFIYEGNHIYTAIPMYNLIEHEIIIQIHQEPYDI